MKVKQLYRRRGTPDLPMATYIGIAGKNMKLNSQTDYHPETEIALQVAGSTTGEIGGKAVHFQADDIWIIPSGVPHRRIAFSEDAVVHRIVFHTDAITMQDQHFFQKEFVKPLAEDRLELPRLLQPGHPAYDAVREALSQLEGCRIYEKNYRQQRLSVLMRICLALMPYCRIKEDVPVLPPTDHEGVKLCMRYIHNNYADKITLEAIAEYCHLHPSYLCTVFKQYMGQSVFEYLTRFRVETAATLLLQKDLTISEIAELVGFRSECLFYRKFKEIMGTTPKAYAQQHKRK